MLYDSRFEKTDWLHRMAKLTQFGVFAFVSCRYLLVRNLIAI
jgi:hypothetical protein